MPAPSADILDRLRNCSMPEDVRVDAIAEIVHLRLSTGAVSQGPSYAQIANALPSGIMTAVSAR